MLLTKKLKQFIVASSIITASGVILINTIVLSFNSGKLPNREYVERPGLEILGIAVLISAIVYIVGRSFYNREAGEIGNDLSIRYHLISSLIVFIAAIVGYIMSNAFWINDVLWVLGLSLLSLSLHISYKKNHIKGTHKKKLFL